MRSDGLDNPLSPNGPRSIGWDNVEDACEESVAVVSYDRDGGAMTIHWCDGSESTHTDPNIAMRDIREMTDC